MRYQFLMTQTRIILANARTNLQAVVRRIPFAVYLGLITFLIVAASLSLFLRARAPMPYMAVLTPKLEAYKANADKYDTVFIGTSRTLYHIIPDTVERSAITCPAISVFNFGIYGLRGAEQEWLIDYVLSVGKPYLKRIILEPPLNETRKFSELTTDRDRYFHGPAHYGARLQSIWGFPESLPKRLIRTGMFGAGIIYDLSSVGRAAAAAFPDPTSHREPTSALPEDGYKALDDAQEQDTLKKREVFLANRPDFEKRLEQHAERDKTNSVARIRYLKRRVDRIKNTGVDATLFISPDVVELNRTAAVGELFARTFQKTNVINLNRPTKYPDLFDWDLWYDFSHLNRMGSTLLSQKIGKSLCPPTTHKAD